MQQFNDFLRTYIGSAFTFIASVCSIVSLGLMFIGDKNSVIIALTTLVLGLMVIVVRILVGINRIIHVDSAEDYKRISSLYVYESANGVNSTFEVFRTIQCKRMFLSSIPYNFKWTGSIIPKISSLAQEISPLVQSNSKNEWDTLLIKFSSPLRYNQCAVVNVKTENDDSDGTAKPWISSRLDSPIEMMSYRVLLSYKPDGYNKPAYFERKKIDTQIDGDYEHVDSVPFNSNHKSYIFTVVNPEAGYIYRLRWEK